MITCLQYTFLYFRLCYKQKCFKMYVMDTLLWIHHFKCWPSFSICFRPLEVTEEDFYRSAMRCGRVLIQEQEVGSFPCLVLFVDSVCVCLWVVAFLARDCWLLLGQVSCIFLLFFYYCFSVLQCLQSCFWCQFLCKSLLVWIGWAFVLLVVFITVRTINFCCFSITGDGWAISMVWIYCSLFATSQCFKSLYKNYICAFLSRTKVSKMCMLFSF